MASIRAFERRALSTLPRFTTVQHTSRRTFAILQTPVSISSSRPCTNSIPRAGSLPFPLKKPIRRIGARARYSTSNTPNPTPHLGSPEAKATLSQRLKKLSREYGWTAVGVYLALSALDFPFCFLAVRTLGTDRIAAWEHAVIEWGKSVLSMAFPDLAKNASPDLDPATELENASLREGSDLHDVELAERSNSGANASIWTQLALAYAIHKSFIFIRVPLTAAILPKVVKTLRGWGWDIGKKGVKAKMP